MFVSVKTEHVKYLRCNFYEKMLIQILIPLHWDQENVILNINFLVYFNNVNLFILSGHLATEIMGTLYLN